MAEVEAVKNEGRKMFAALRALNIRPPNELTGYEPKTFLRSTDWALKVHLA